MDERDHGPRPGSDRHVWEPDEGPDPDERDLLAVVAHDLRSPLATARGFVELLRQRWDDIDEPDRLYYLERAAAHLGQLNEMMSDLLDAGRRSAALTASEPVVFDVGRLAHEVTSAFDETHPDRRIIARIASSPPRVVAAPGQIERVLRNLIVNALSYSPAGSPVEVDVEDRAGEVLISVRDHGWGISAGDQRQLFRRFSRLAQDGQGSGLGLYICRRLVESQGGRIWVDSEPGRGSTFTVALPAA